MLFVFRHHPRHVLATMIASHMVPKTRVTALAVLSAAVETMALDPCQATPPALQGPGWPTTRTLLDFTYHFDDCSQPVYVGLPKRPAVLQITVGQLGSMALRLEERGCGYVSYGQLLRAFLDLRHKQLQDMGPHAGKSLRTLDAVWVHNLSSATEDCLRITMGTV